MAFVENIHRAIQSLIQKIGDVLGEAQEWICSSTICLCDSEEYKEGPHAQNVVDGHMSGRADLPLGTNSTRDKLNSSRHTFSLDDTK